MSKPTVTLTKNGTSVVLPAPVRFSRSIGDEAEIEFHSLTGAEKDALASFFKDTARDMLEGFTFTDPAGEQFQVRFAEPALVFVQFARDDWDCSIQIVEEIR